MASACTVQCFFIIFEAPQGPIIKNDLKKQKSYRLGMIEGSIIDETYIFGPKTFNLHIHFFHVCVKEHCGVFLVPVTVLN